MNALILAAAFSVGDPLTEEPNKAYANTLIATAQLINQKQLFKSGNGIAVLAAANALTVLMLERMGPSDPTTFSPFYVSPTYNLVCVRYKDEYGIQVTQAVRYGDLVTSLPDVAELCRSSNLSRMTPVPYTTTINYASQIIRALEAASKK